MRTSIIVILLFVGFAANAQTYWAKKQAGSNVDETLGITGDASGNTYTTGYFSTSATINGSAQLVNGLTDIFLTKIDASGGNVWVKTAGGSSSDRGLDIAVDSDGNVIVCGFFSGTINFGNGVSITSNSGSQDAFVAKFDSNGNPVWARAGGSGGNSDRANAVAVDNSGNIVITGQYSGDASFGGENISSLNGSVDIFIVRYDASGNVLWAKSGSADGNDRGLSVATDNSGAVYAVGQFSGDISFDNSYSNTILNALFLVKYSESGNEQWFRWAGGSEQSIANGITSDGTNVYLTGDFGNSISFLGDGTSTLNSGYSNAVFVAAYSGSGSLLWKESQGSESEVSARAISYGGGDLAIAGWYTCTFQSLSNEYGESAFNSIGFKDAYVMRYSASGSFEYGRNFGSQTDERCTGVHILPDGNEVLTGVFSDKIIVPVSSPMPSGLSEVSNAPNAGNTYCGDPDYGLYGLMLSDGNQEDGFTIKALNPDRSPFDYYQRFGSGCDLSIPDVCISRTFSPVSYDCSETIFGCPTYNVVANNFIPNGSELGYEANYSWNPSSANDAFLVSQPGDVSVTVSSADGCYQEQGSVYVDLYESPDAPLLSDNAVVNTMSANPEPIYLCPGEEVDIWADYPAGYTFYWLGPGIDASGQTNLETITVSDPGQYSITVQNENGCSANTSVTVIVYEVPPENVEPYLAFDTENDTLRICGNSDFIIQAYDFLTGEQINSQLFDWTWSIEPDGTIFQGGSSTTGSATADGWYVVTVEFETEENPCTDGIDTYTATDSVYVEQYPVPSASVSVSGPPFACPGDTLTLLIEWEGDTLNVPASTITNFSDSVYVSGPGDYIFSSSSVNEFGCEASASAVLHINEVNTPQITSTPEPPVVCPGDSVLLETADLGGEILWQGPFGSISDTTSIFVDQAGAYYTEVTFYEGCALVSNTIDVLEYATPYIAGNDGVMCPGIPLEISIESPSVTDIMWLAPLTGSDSVQVITEPGIYTAQVTSCEIVSQVMIEIEMDTNTVAIQQPDLNPKCDGDSIFIEAIPGSYPEYNWSPQGSGAEVYFTQPGSIQAIATDEFGCELESNTIEIDFEAIPPTPEFDYTLVCEGDTQLIEINSPFELTYLDEPGGTILPNSSVIEIPDFLSDTTFYVFLSSEYCEGSLDSLTIGPKPFPDSPILASDGPACTGTSVNLVVLNPNSEAEYNWSSPSGSSFTGQDVNHSVPDLGEEGIYFCFADLAGCLSDTVPIPVSLFETREVELPPDTGMCYRGDILLSPQGSFADYLWQDGSSDSTFAVSQTSDIFVITHDENGCESSDQMYIELVDCNPEIPNIFTPNGDGKNDNWVVSLDQPRFAHIVVFNRWGTKVYDSNNLSEVWDGNNDRTGEPCSEGVYFYIVHLSDYEGTNIEDHGSLTLIRD